MEKNRNVLSQSIRKYGILIAMIAITLIFEILTGGILLKPINVSRLIFQNSYILILTVGMMLCILTGGNIDLSVGSIVAMVGAASAIFSVKLGLPVLVSIFLALVVGLLAGMWQGFWIAFVKIPPFIVTLAGLLIFDGVNNIILDGKRIPLPQLYITIASASIPDFFSIEGGLHLTTIAIGIVCSILFAVIKIISRANKKKAGYDTESANLFRAKTIAAVLAINLFTFWLARANGLTYAVILLVVLVVAYSFITNKTTAGRRIYALGGNAKAAELSGVNTKKVMFWVYANMGFLAAIAGIVFAGRLNSATPTAGEGFELDAIAACFIGGASASGGVGTIIGAVIGGFIMGIMDNGMSIMGINVFWRDIIKGLVTIFAVAFDVYSKSKAKAA